METLNTSTAPAAILPHDANLELANLSGKLTMAQCEERMLQRGAQDNARYHANVDYGRMVELGAFENNPESAGKMVAKYFEGKGGFLSPDSVKTYVTNFQAFGTRLAIQHRDATDKLARETAAVTKGKSIFDIAYSINSNLNKRKAKFETDLKNKKVKASEKSKALAKPDAAFVAEILKPKAGKGKKTPKLTGIALVRKTLLDTATDMLESRAKYSDKLRAALETIKAELGKAKK